jgi:hypothetical protein
LAAVTDEASEGGNLIAGTVFLDKGVLKPTSLEFLEAEEMHIPTTLSGPMAKSNKNIN